MSTERQARDVLGVVTIGAREIYDQLVGLREDVRSLTQSHSDVAAALDDHEERLRSVERWKYAVPTAAIGGLVAAGMSIAKALGG